MAAKTAKLEINRSFSKTEMDRIKMGFLPEAMEDKWFIFYEDDELHFCSSWTGYCVFRVRFETTRGSARIAEAEVCRNKRYYRSADDDHDAALVLYLIDVLLLNNPCTESPVNKEFAEPAEQAFYQWSEVGRAMFGEGPRRTAIRETAIAVPFDRSYWVLPGELMAGYYPGDKSPIQAEQKLRSLLESGIRCFIDLTGEGDVDHSGKPMIPYQAELARLARSMCLTISYKRIPVPDTGIPTRSVMRRILNHIDRALGQNLPVYVHCWGGRGRTGTVIGCYLARMGIAAGVDALRTIEKLRRDVPDARQPSPENERQCQFVHS